MANQTAVILIDPYNDFLHPNGKLNPRLAESIAATGTIEHLKEVVATARKNKIPIYYCLHVQTDKYSFEGWHMMNWSLTSLKENLVFEKGSWGAGIYEGLEPDPENGDVVVSQHINSSSFQNTDLDYQLRQRGIRNLVLAGLVSNTCIEATARYGYELGYDLTMLSDGTAGFSTEQKDAATNLIWPLFANRVLTVEQPECLRCVSRGIRCSGPNTARIYVHRNAANMRTQSHRGALRIAMQRRTAHAQSDLDPETQEAVTVASSTTLEVIQRLLQRTRASLLRATTSLTALPEELFYSTLLDAFQPKDHTGLFSGDRIPSSPTEGDCSSVAVCIRSLLPLARRSERHILDKSIFCLLTMYLSLLVKDPRLTEMARAAYTSAVQEFRLFIGSRFAANLAHPETSYCQLFLALSTTLQLFEYVNDLGKTRWGFLTHYEGMLQLLQISGPDVYQSPHLLQSFSGLRGIIIFITLQKRRPSVLSEPQWIYRPFFCRPKTRREILHDIALGIPTLLHRADDLIPMLVQNPQGDQSGPSDLSHELRIARGLAADFAKVKADLEAWLHNLEQSCSPDPIYWSTDTVVDHPYSHSDPMCVPSFEDPKYQLRFRDGQKAGVLICYWSFMLELLMSLIDVQTAVVTLAASGVNSDAEDIINAVCEDMDANRAAADNSAFLILQSIPYLNCCLEGVFVMQSPLSLVQRYFARS
ncbi:hypothetical protein AYL99_06932 [Fonsecaea erecta]|uniref:Isochorismatase-like domain-containing protein n=1 Tax=Fonsecaea erecta TaxID=1367422 RepID=A0A178ZIM5_9EURO|nr:hypothetical protein AYL99_06932 [Fonsecaea erecta]OAP59634.1 hypothetical protein AYL99_06932 [Fonsecaea erecta]